MDSYKTGDVVWDRVLAVKNQHENKLSVAEMRVLCWICGKTRRDMTRNDNISESVGAAPIIKKMVETRLRWFGEDM